MFVCWMESCVVQWGRTEGLTWILGLVAADCSMEMLSWCTHHRLCLCSWWCSMAVRWFCRLWVCRSDLQYPPTEWLWSLRVVPQCPPGQSRWEENVMPLTTFESVRLVIEDEYNMICRSLWRTHCRVGCAEEHSQEEQAQKRPTNHPQYGQSSLKMARVKTCRSRVPVHSTTVDEVKVNERFLCFLNVYSTLTCRTLPINEATAAIPTQAKPKKTPGRLEII